MLAAICIPVCSEERDERIKRTVQGLCHFIFIAGELHKEIDAETLHGTAAQNLIHFLKRFEIRGIRRHAHARDRKRKHIVDAVVGVRHNGDGIPLHIAENALCIRVIHKAVHTGRCRKLCHLTFVHIPILQMLFFTCILLYSGWFVNRVAQEVFVAELAGMYLNGDVAGQLAIELLIHFNDLFRGDRFCEINLGFHENSS